MVYKTSWVTRSLRALGWLSFEKDALLRWKWFLDSTDLKQATACIPGPCRPPCAVLALCGWHLLQRPVLPFLEQVSSSFPWVMLFTGPDFSKINDCQMLLQPQRACVTWPHINFLFQLLEFSHVLHPNCMFSLFSENPTAGPLHQQVPFLGMLFPDVYMIPLSHLSQNFLRWSFFH